MFGRKGPGSSNLEGNRGKPGPDGDESPDDDDGSGDGDPGEGVPRGRVVRPAGTHTSQGVEIWMGPNPQRPDYIPRDLDHRRYLAVDTRGQTAQTREIEDITTSEPGGGPRHRQPVGASQENGSQLGKPPEACRAFLEAPSLLGWLLLLLLVVAAAVETTDADEVLPSLYIRWPKCKTRKNGLV